MGPPNDQTDLNPPRIEDGTRALEVEPRSGGAGSNRALRLALKLGVSALLASCLVAALFGKNIRALFATSTSCHIVRHTPHAPEVQQVQAGTRAFESFGARDSAPPPTTHAFRD